jgi:hypothetical protein
VRTRSLGWTMGASSSSNNASPTSPGTYPGRVAHTYDAVRLYASLRFDSNIYITYRCVSSCGDWQFSRRPACDGPGLQRPSNRLAVGNRGLNGCMTCTSHIRFESVLHVRGREKVYRYYISQDFVLGYVVGLKWPRRTRCPQAEGEYI